jgi:restriction endonuclease S subunit
VICYWIKYFNLCKTIAWVVGHISVNDVKNFNIPFPSLEVQERIANEVKGRVERAKWLEKEARESYEGVKGKVEEMILDF